jgi:hypothetical protein
MIQEVSRNDPDACPPLHQPPGGAMKATAVAPQFTDIGPDDHGLRPISCLCSGNRGPI